MKNRILFALPGLHRVARGAEAAFEQIAAGLCGEGFDVTLIGAGSPLPDRPYAYLQGRLTPRERFRRWPSFPPLRSEYRWEELTFAPSLWRLYDPAAYDLTVTCSYPFVNWLLRAKHRAKRHPLHVFVTENGDWPACAGTREYRWFGCDGLVCTNPEYLARNQAKYRSVLIPNGVDTDRFTPGVGDRAAFGLPPSVPVVCMVSALIPSKFPMDGIRAVAALPEAHLLLGGDGPLKEPCDALGRELLGDRYHRVTVPMSRMPSLYRCGDVFMHLSRDEAFGNIYIEASACGVPVVAHDTPVTRWILGEQGHFADTSDADALVRLLRSVLADTATAACVRDAYGGGSGGGRDARGPRDPAVRAQAAHRAIAERFAWPVVCRQYATFFRELLA